MFLCDYLYWCRKHIYCRFSTFLSLFVLTGLIANLLIFNWAHEDILRLVEFLASQLMFLLQ